MNDKLLQYIETLESERTKLINRSADFALTAIVQKHNGKEDEFNKFNINCLVTWYQNQLLETVIKGLKQIIDTKEEAGMGSKTINVSGI